MCSSQDGVGTEGNKCPFPQMDDAKKTHTQLKLDVTHKLGSHVQVGTASFELGKHILVSVLN